MKKIISIIISVCLVVSLFTACAKDNQVKEENGKINVVATIFPIYDWVENVAGEDVHLDLSLLMSNGVDLHNFQPTADDIIKISTCDVFIYVGGESDEWVEDTLESAQNKNMKVINLMNVLGASAKEEETVEGMQEEDEHDEEDGPEYDEHVWLSLKNAQLFVNEIAKVFSQVDNEDAEIFASNASIYNEKLKNLDIEYATAVSSAKTKTLVFADRFPFRYLTDDYGLKYYAAFVGCSAETEASFETISFLANKIDELKIKNVITIDSSDQKIAKTVISSTKEKNQNILTLDSIQSVNEQQIEKGTTYLSVMQNNLEVLKQALN